MSKKKPPEYYKKYREKNKEKIKVREKEYRSARKEHIMTRDKQYRERPEIKYMAKERNRKETENRREARLKYMEENKTVLLEKKKLKYELYKERERKRSKELYHSVYKQRRQFEWKKQREELSDSYVSQLLRNQYGLKNNDIEQIDLLEKRQIISYKRELKQLKAI